MLTTIEPPQVPCQFPRVARPDGITRLCGVSRKSTGMKVDSLQGREKNVA